MIMPVLPSGCDLAIHMESVNSPSPHLPHGVYLGATRPKTMP
jgi:hypothetical protein